MATRTLVQALIELVRPELQDLHTRELTLKEEGRGASTREVKLTTRGRVLAVRPDRLAHTCDLPDCHARSGSANERAFPFFNPHRAGLTALCDYMLFHEPSREAPPTVFLCELKSGKTAGAGDQLRNGRLLAEHLIAAARLHGDVHHHPDVMFRGVVFTPRATAPKPGLKEPRFPFIPDDRLRDLRVLRLPPGPIWDLDALCAARTA
jgi:hypothetical protein